LWWPDPDSRKPFPPRYESPPAGRAGIPTLHFQRPWSLFSDMIRRSRVGSIRRVIPSTLKTSPFWISLLQRYGSWSKGGSLWGISSLSRWRPIFKKIDFTAMNHALNHIRFRIGPEIYIVQELLACLKFIIESDILIKESIFLLSSPFFLV
jgi:hypothetical protein